MSQIYRTDRTSLSLFLSTALHGSVIALVALGPAYLPGMMGNSNGDGSMINPVEVSINTPTQNQSVVANNRAVHVPDQPVPKPTEKIQESPVAVVEKPKTPAPAPKAKKAKPAIEPVAKSEVATELPEKTVEPEIVEESPTKNDDIKEMAQPTIVPVEDQSAAAADEAIAQAEALPAQIEEPAPTPAPPPPQISEQPTSIAEASNAAPSGSATTANTAQPGAAGTKEIVVTQNYLQLRQLPGNKAPIYTNDMRLRQLQGQGQLVYYVNREGRVADIHLVKSTGSAELDQAALDAFKKYKFVPGQEGYTIHDFQFVLKGPAVPTNTRLRTTAK